MIVTSTTTSSTISSSNSGQWNNVSSNSNINGNNHSNHSNSSSNQSGVIPNNTNNNGNSNTWNNNGGYGSKFEYNHWVRIPLEPIRAACLRYAKTFSKVEQAMGNRVFFQFDSEGIILRAQDKNSLATAQKQFSQLSRINQIELLTSGLDQEEYRQVIMRDIKNQGKYGKCFVQLIPYDAFRAIAIQLKNFGYEEPLRQYEKYMKLYPKFAFLLCHEANFAAVKLELLRLLKATPSTASISKEKERTELDQLENSQKGKKYEFQKNMNQSVQYIKKEESKESKEKQAIKKWEALAEEDRLSDKEDLEEEHNDHKQNDEIDDRQELEAEDNDQSYKLESNNIIQENENNLIEKDQDKDKKKQLKEWEIEQQRIREISIMSREEKDDNFSKLLAELDSSVLILEGNNHPSTNGSTEKDIDNLPNINCQVLIGIQDSHRVQAHGLCVVWALLSKQLSEEDIIIRVDKQKRVILDGLNRQLGYDLSSLSFLDLNDNQNLNEIAEIIPKDDSSKIIIPFQQLIEYIQQIKNEDLQRVCENDLIRYTKNNIIDFEGNDLNVVLQRNLNNQQSKYLQQHQNQKHQQQLSSIQKSKLINEYSTYPSFDINECRLIKPIHGSQTAYIVEFKQQLYCLKIIHRISDRQLHNTFANFEEHLQAENQQLLQIYSIAVFEASSKSISATSPAQGMTQEINQKGQNPQSSQKLLQIRQQLMQQTQEQHEKQQHQQNNVISQLFSGNEHPQDQQQHISQIQQDSNEHWDVFILSDLKPSNLKNAIESKHFKIFSQSMSAAMSLTIALKNLHEKQVHHGNLKPQNVLFDSDYNVILSDIAQGHKKHSASVLQTNIEKQQQQHQQTFQQKQQQQYQQQQLQQQLQSSQSSFPSSPTSIYIAPELVKGGDGKIPRSDTRSDIWNLGFLFLEIFSALPNFNKTELPKKKKKRASTAADDTYKAITAIKALISKCHAKNPFARPPIKDVLVELKDISKSIQE